MQPNLTRQLSSKISATATGTTACSGENLPDVVITGKGLINCRALTREAKTTGGNKAIALKLSRNVTIRDIAILSGGDFGIPATGVDNLTVDNVRINTNRDSVDINGCHNGRLSNLNVNSPNDDAIVFKASHALGFRRATLENTFFFQGSGGVSKWQPYNVPEHEMEYPETALFGLLPAYGLYL